MLAGVLLLCVAVWVGVWGGCSIEKHYDLLSFFFDGVPDPALLAASKDELWRVREAGGTIYTHEPYAKELCNECHRGETGVMLTKVDSSACLKCHADVPRQHPMMHGPVAAGACLWCHAPHESTIPSLLRTSPTRLCRQCHDTTLGGHSRIPEHTDPERNCLDCHTGHGGDDRYFVHTRSGAPHQR